MGRKNKMSLDFKGFEEYYEKLDSLGGDLKEVTEKALVTAHQLITPAIHKRMQFHKRTGKTEDSIAEIPNVYWEGTTASIDVGFHITDGGLPSVFLMYGTPRQKPDKTLYNLIYGRVVRKEVGKRQKEIFEDAIKKRMEG